MFGRHFWYGALCVTLLTIAVLMTQAKAQSTTRSFYDNRGSFAGSSVTRGNSTSFSDGQGRFSGSAIRHGNSTSFYDKSGHYAGSSINTSPKR
jgi:hypothetical protein